MSKENVLQLVDKITWLRPILCIINQNNFVEHVSLICQCLAVNQKYLPVLKAIAPFVVTDKHIATLSKLLSETTYLTVNSVLEMFQPPSSRQSLQAFVAVLLQNAPSSETVQTIQQYLSSEKIRSRIDFTNPFLIFSAMLTTRNLDICLAFCENGFPLLDDFVLDEGEVKKICAFNNSRLIEHISTNLYGRNRQSFYYKVVFQAALMNKIEVFQAFYELAKIQDEQHLWHLVENAVIGGNVDIVKFCISQCKVLPPQLGFYTWRRAYATGDVALIDFLKQNGFVPNLRSVARDYIQNFDAEPVTLNPILLRELLNAHPNIEDAMNNLIVCILNQSQQYFNVDEEIFRICAEFAPNFRINFHYQVQYVTRRLIWCLMYFKRCLVPSGDFTKEQMLELATIFPPSQFTSKPSVRAINIKEILFESINVKRTVYLYFAQETELRDNVELILEYIN